jgi:DNA-binding response OmpR family regulator
MTRRRGDYGKQRLAYGDISLDGETFELAASNAVRLSVKEFELMQTLVLNASHKLSYSYLLGHVWRTEPDADQDTVRLYVSYLRGKLMWVGSHVTIVNEDGGFRLTVEAGA